MPLSNRAHRISLFCIFCAFSSAAAVAQSTHYSVKLEPDFERQLLRGDETIEFQADAGEIEWQKQAGLRLAIANIANGEVDRKSTRLNSSHRCISYAVFCLKKKTG